MFFVKLKVKNKNKPEFYVKNMFDYRREGEKKNRPVSGGRAHAPIFIAKIKNP
jgi:hypothetical protein